MNANPQNHMHFPCFILFFLEKKMFFKILVIYLVDYFPSLQDRI